MKRTEQDSKAKKSAGARKAGTKRAPRPNQTGPGKVKTSARKVRVSMFLDADVIEYFKGRAGLPNAAPYQTQINSELRAVMELNDRGAPYLFLVDDDRFIAAVAERLRRRRRRRSGGGRT
jgi:uncharacterized protein (DUF4415 family)